jgi:hypothetical protein
VANAFSQLPQGIQVTIGIFGWLLCLYWVRALRLAREGARRFVHDLCLGGLAFIGCRLIAMGLHVQDAATMIFSALCGIAFFVRARGNNAPRSRYIPAKIRRAVIARDLGKKRYNPSKHHIDHRWPFSRGGSHTMDNLRVVERARNLKKGAKRPPLWDMW